MTIQELAIEDVKFIGTSVQPRLAAAFGMTPLNRQQLADTVAQFTAPGPDGRSALYEAVTALRDGSDRAIQDAWGEVDSIMRAANGAAAREAVTGLESKSVLQTLAGTSVAAGVIQGGAFAAGVQDSLGIHGPAADIAASVNTGSGQQLVDPALKAGKDFGKVALIGGGIALVVGGLVLAWYLTR